MKNEKDMSMNTMLSTNSEHVFHLNKTYSIEYVLSPADICINQINEFSWKKNLTSNDSPQQLTKSKLRDYICMLSSSVDSLDEVATVCKSDWYQYEAIYSIKKALEAGDLLDENWFIPGMLHWKKIFFELLDAEIKDDGTISFRDYDKYTQKKKELNLSGKYWIYPASFTDKFLLFIDFDENHVSSVGVLLGKKFKVRPIRIVKNEFDMRED